MRNRLWLSVLVLSLLFSLNLPASAAISVNFSIAASSDNMGDALLMGAAALFFGLDSDVTMQYKTTIGSATGVVSTFYLSAETQSEPEAFISEKKKGRGWGAIAKGKMPPGLVGKVKGNGDPFSYNDKDFETGVNVHFLATYYAVPESMAIAWVKRGITIQDLALSLNLAARAKVTPSTVVDLKLGGQSWTQLSSKYKISMQLIGEPVAPKVKHNKGVPAKKPKKNK